MLQRIYKNFDGKMALNCWVVEPGRIGIGIGDAVELLDDYRRSVVPPPGGRFA